jgi:predicted DNA-binding antitoxin AbrB/MazE fold protein
MMKDCQIVDAVYEHETLHPLTPLRGLKEQARVRLRVWLAEGTEDKSTGLAALCGGWEGSDALAASVAAVYRSRSEARSLPAL